MEHLPDNDSLQKHMCWSLMKYMPYLTVEELPELAKTIIMLEDDAMKILNVDLSNQYKLSSAIFNAIEHYTSKVNVTIVDGAPIQGIYYNRKYQHASDKTLTEKMIVERLNKLPPVFTVFVSPGDLPYRTDGRYQTEDEAAAVGQDLKNIIDEFNVKVDFWFESNTSYEIYKANFEKLMIAFIEWYWNLPIRDISADV